MSETHDETPEMPDTTDTPDVIDSDDTHDTPDAARPAYRGGDPFFGFLLAIAVSIGLTPILPAQASLRYTLAWGALALVSVLAWLLGNMERIGQEDPIDLAWGIGFGLLLSAPFALFLSDVFAAASRLIFAFADVSEVEPIIRLMSPGVVLAYLVFIMPLAETLFFRGLMQRQLEFWLVGGLATLWSVVLFFPMMWGELLESPAVGIFFLVALLTMNLLYSYVRERNGLAAAWLCQITTGLALFFVPFL